MSQSRTLHVAMFPWLAFGHLTPYLRLANKLAQKGHRISLLMPPKALSKLQSLNLHPDLISFIPIAIPHVDGLPEGAETTADILFYMNSILVKAMDRTQKDVEASFRDLKPDVVLFDMAHWIPALATRLGIKSVHYYIGSPLFLAYLLVPDRLRCPIPLTEQPPGFPPSTVRLLPHEALSVESTHNDNEEFGEGMPPHERHLRAYSDCNAISFRSCQEIEGPFCDYIGSQYNRSVLLSGPVLPDPLTSPLVERWGKWLGEFKAGSVVYCAFGSECVLKMDQFQELLLGLELMGLPFLVALKPPEGAETIEEALPEGFEERVKGRGVVWSGWMQQQLILGHPSVGCFVSHCGPSSIYEALINECQLVLVPYALDQFFHARIMSGDLKVGVEVEKEDDGKFTRESVRKAIKLVMDEESQLAKELRANHAKLRETLLSENYEASYIDGYSKKLQDLCSS